MSIEKKLYEMWDKNSLVNQEEIYEKMKDITPRNTLNPDNNTQIDDKIPYLSTELTSSDIMNLIQRLKDFSTKRADLTKMYEAMVKDSIIGSAIELIAEDSSISSPATDLSYWVQSDNKAFEEDMNKWLKNIIKINRFSTKMAYMLITYGDLVLETFNEHEDAKTKFITPSMHFDIIEEPHLVNELTLYGKRIGFQVIDPDNQNNNKIYNKSEFIHVYRDYGDKERFKTQFKDKEGVKHNRVLESPYGRGYLYNAIQIFNIIDLLDTSLLSQYINKTQVTRLVNIEVGSAGKKETREIIGEIKRAFRQSSLDLNKQYKEGSKASTISNIYVPIRNGKSDTRIEEIGGNLNIQEISGLDTYLDRLFSALRVPKAFLGLDANGGFLDASMIRKDIRYARMVRSVQDLVAEAVKDMVSFRKSKTKFNNDDIEFTIEYTSSSSIEELEEIEESTSRLAYASSLAEFIRSNPHVNKEEFDEYIINTILQLQNANKFFDKSKTYGDDTPKEDEI